MGLLFVLGATGCKTLEQSKTDLLATQAEADRAAAEKATRETEAARAAADLETKRAEANKAAAEMATADKVAAAKAARKAARKAAADKAEAEKAAAEQLATTKAAAEKDARKKAAAEAAARLAAMGRIAEAQADPLQVQIDLSGDDAPESMKEPLADTLRQAGLKLDGPEPDLKVTIRFQATEFDRSGNYYVFDGQAAVEARVAADQRLLDSKTFKLRAERQLGRDEAVAAVAAQLTAALTPWVKETLTHHSVGLAAVRLRVSLPTDVAPATYAPTLQAALAGLDGVLALQPQAKSGREATYRVLYIRDRQPNGIPRALAARPDLRLRISP
jgi:hypothetical protein